MQVTTDSPWGSRLIESLVIVGSILAAFAIDAWWEGRQDAERVAALVDLLVADIEADVEELRTRVARSDSLVVELDALLAIGGDTEVAPSTPQVGDLIRAVGSTSQTDPSLSAYEVVRGTDAWDQIPPGIKVSLSEYMRGPFSVDRARDTDALKSLTDLAGRYGGLPEWFRDKPTSSTRMFEYLKDPAVQSWMLVHRDAVAAELRWQRRWLERLPPISEALDSVRDD